jgi:hypothetical protein
MLFVDFKHGALSKVRAWDSNDKQYWNKSTDVNVQVFGEVLEAGSTLAALAPADGFLPAPSPNTGGGAVEPWRPTLEEFAPFVLVQPGITIPMVLPLLAAPPYPLSPDL